MRARGELLIVAGLAILKVMLVAFAVMVSAIVNPDYPLPHQPCINLWNQWDARHYLSIAAHGYGPSGDARLCLAFWPLYPAAIWLVNLVANDLMLSALLVSTVASTVAALELYWLARLDHSDNTALLAVASLFLFPTSYFLHIGYSEALFLALVLGSFLAVRAASWPRAGFLAALASLTHVNGVLLMPALGAEALLAMWRTHKFRLEPSLAYLGSPLLAVASYLLFNYLLTGDSLAFLTVEHQNWEHHTVLPWHSIADMLGMARGGGYNGEMAGVQGLLFIGLGGVLTVISAVLLPVSYTVWMATNWLLMTSQSWDISAPRYALALFPMFMLIARAAQRWPLPGAAAGFWSLLWLATFTAQFIAGHWTF